MKTQLDPEPLGSDLFDDDGYPTDASLEALATYSGTPGGLIEYAASLYRGGAVSVEDCTDPLGRARKRVEFVTCGWSGAESVGSTLHGTLFHVAYWAESHRGGLTIYEVPATMWGTHGDWGVPGKSDADPLEAAAQAMWDAAKPVVVGVRPDWSTVATDPDWAHSVGSTRDEARVAVQAALKVMGVST